MFAHQNYVTLDGGKGKMSRGTVRRLCSLLSSREVCVCVCGYVCS